VRVQIEDASAFTLFGEVLTEHYAGAWRTTCDIEPSITGNPPAPSRISLPLV
jgi:hypothetical protein